jgi:hypothetical protein
VAAETDPIGVALGSIGAGATAGASVITTSLIVFRLLMGGAADAMNQDLQFAVLTVGLVAGVITSVVTVYTLARTVTDTWRRAALAGTTVFAAAILAVPAAPADMFAGLVGLTVYLAVLLSGTWYGISKVRAAAGE